MNKIELNRLNQVLQYILNLHNCTVAALLNSYLSVAAKLPPEPTYICSLIRT